MNICFFEGDMSRGGGTERLTTLTVNNLSLKPDFKIFVLSLFFRGNKLYFKLNENIEHHVLCDQQLSKYKTIINLFSFIKSHNIDILVNVDIMLGVFSLPLKFFLKRLRIISWDMFSVSNDMGVSWSRQMRRISLYFSDIYITLTDGDKKELEKINYRKNNLKLLYNPIECINTAFDYDLNSCTIMTAGNFYYTKGFDLAVDVAKIVFSKHPDWKWFFYGDGLEFNKVQNKVREYKLENNVIFSGRVSDLEKRYHDAAMYVMTSRNEGFGLVLLEAKNNNLPTIAFDVPYGPSTIIEDSISGFLIKPFDIECMANKINLLIEDNDLRFDFAQKAQNNLNKFSIEKFSESWHAFFKYLADN